MPLLKIVGTDGTLGRRMTVGDFVAIAPLLVDTAPTLDAMAAKLKELADTESTKIGSIARSLHAYIFSTRAIYGKNIHSLRVASRQVQYKNMNDDIVNAMYSALISKHHVRYLKVEEGRAMATKGPNEGSESQIIDEALSGYLMDVNKYTKKNIISKLQVTSDDVLIDTGADEKVKLTEITTTEPYGGSAGMRHIAMHIGLEDLYNDIVSTYNNNYTSAQVDKNVISTFKKIIEIAAVNSEDGTNRLSLSKAMEGSVESVAIHKDYMYLSPSAMIKEDDQKNLADVFFVDSSKAQRIGDKTTQSSTTPNKNTTLKRQVATTKKFNDEKVTPTDMSHIPMLITEQQEGSHIIPAEVSDVFIKAPIVYDGNVIGVPDWDAKIRLEHAMIEGFLEGPKRNVGKEFFLQVTNYSDKTSPELFSITTEENLLSTKEGVHEGIKQA